MNWTSCWVILDINSGPLSDCRDEGRPNLGIISVRRIWATVWALLFVVRNASFYPSQKGVHKDQEEPDSEPGAYE